MGAIRHTEGSQPESEPDQPAPADSPSPLTSLHPALLCTPQCSSCTPGPPPAPLVLSLLTLSSPCCPQEQRVNSGYGSLGGEDEDRG
ncbi:hypothetical protein H8959_004468 [Pygathrix nigripes]